MPLSFLRGRRLRHHLRLHYPCEVIETPHGFYHGRYPDLPGCGAIGRTPAELYAALERERRLWLEERIRADLTVPRPNDHARGRETQRQRAG